MQTEIKQDQLPEQVVGFEQVESLRSKMPGSNYDDNIADHDLLILDLEEADLKWRQQARKLFSGIFTAVLVLQNLGVAWLLYAAYTEGKLEGLALISSGLVVGTLAETAFIVRIMVQWVFSDVRYEVRRK